MSAEGPVPLLHVGYHKTGSTLLQKRLFVPALGFDLLALPLAVRRFVDCDPWDLAPVPVEPATPGTVRVVSHERFSGHPMAAGFDAPQVLDRLARSLPGSRVLIVVREQVSAIVSLYAQYVRGGGGASLEHVLHGLPGASAQLPWFRMRHFDYAPLVTAYQERFGADRVLVLAYEQLRADPAAFLTAILRFADAPVQEAPTVAASRVNERLSGPALVLKRLGNRWFVVNRYSPGPPVPSARAQHALARVVERLDGALLRRLPDRVVPRWTAAVEEAVGDRFAAGNARLAAATGLDLAGYGYALGSADAAGGAHQEGLEAAQHQP